MCLYEYLSLNTLFNGYSNDSVRSSLIYFRWSSGSHLVDDCSLLSMSSLHSIQEYCDCALRCDGIDEHVQHAIVPVQVDSHIYTKHCEDDQDSPKISDELSQCLGILHHILFLALFFFGNLWAVDFHVVWSRRELHAMTKIFQLSWWLASCNRQRPHTPFVRALDNENKVAFLLQCLSTCSIVRDSVVPWRRCLQPSGDRNHDYRSTQHITAEGLRWLT